MLRFLLILTVLWCGLHVDAPAHAAVSGGGAVTVIEPHHSGQDDGAADEDAATHAGHHHHCPNAPSARVAVLNRIASSGDTLVFAPAATALASRAQAPPTQPPSA